VIRELIRELMIRELRGVGGGWWLRLTQHGGNLRDLAVAKGEKKKFASEG
jgi:hypothetical protein